MRLSQRFAARTFLSAASSSARRRHRVAGGYYGQECPRASVAVGAFTLTEMLIAVTIMALAVGVFAIFSESTGRTLASLVGQASHNQTAGNASEFIIGRIRMANSVTNSGGGNTITLGFDDDPDADSNGDGTTWNDQDHFEVFQFVDGDNNAATLGDNMIIYKANASSSDSTVIVPADTRKLSGGSIFTVTNRTVLINFGLLTTNATPVSQQIEIRTRAALRNRTEAD